MIKITHILEQGSSPVNEDRILVSAPLFGVFDGATSLTPAPGRTADQPPATGGAMAATIARDTFALNHHSLTDLASHANRAIRSRMEARGIDLNRPEQVWSTSAAVVRIKGQALEWFRTGDAQILAIDAFGEFQALGPVHDHDFPTLAMMQAQKDKTLNNPMLRRQVLKVRQSMNHTYGVLNGQDQAQNFFSHGLLDLDRVRSVLLFTDGLSLPSPSPSARPDFSPLVREYLLSGLSGLHQKIRTLEAQDPNRNICPRFKCHDDIAAIALDFEPGPANHWDPQAKAWS